MGFFLLVFSVLIVPSVFDPNLGRVGFSCGDREKLSVSILNKLGFVNDVEGLFGFLEAGSSHTHTHTHTRTHTHTNKQTHTHTHTQGYPTSVDNELQSLAGD